MCPTSIYTGDSSHLLRRSDSVHHGVVCESVVENGKWTIYSLLSGGELWPHQESDVMLYMSGFVDGDLIARCGTCQSTMLNEGEIAARVSVLKRLRNFEIAAEQRSTELYHQLRGLYPKLRHPDPMKVTTVTAEQAARVLVSSPDVDFLTKWAIHKYLFDKSKLFVAEQADFLARPIFTVRSKRDVDDIEAVDEMVTRRDVVIDSFVEKARRLVQAARKREQDTWTHAPSYQVDDSTTFTPQEMSIVRFFRGALRGTRSTQKDPYSVSISYILKRVGLYDRQNLGPLAVHPFLVELGVLPPWEDPIERDHVSREERTSIGLALLDSSLVRDHPASSAVGTATTSRPTPPPPLGPEDFYSRDLVDHLRHDFGDLPAYVIDDANAEELDDAISIERIPTEPERAWLHVHVADPTSVLPPTHRIAREALGRMQTHYYLDSSVPMLPDAPQLRGLSLGDTAAQLVMTFSGKVDLEGNILDYKVRPAIIRNARKLQYNDVSEAIGIPVTGANLPFGGGERLIHPSNAAAIEKSVVDDIRLTKKFTDALSSSRIRRGAMQYAWPAAVVTIHPKPLPKVAPITNRPYLWTGFPQLDFRVEDHRSQEEGARHIVAENMRMASRISSMWLRDHNVPALRRVSRAPMEAAPGALEQLLNSRDEHGYMDFFQMQRTGILFSGAKYELTPGPHAVLGIPDGEGYMRTTSPLRRFLDMLTHWQIKHAMLSPSAPRVVPDEWLQDFAAHATWWETHQRRIERNHGAYWAYKFLQRWLVEHAGSPEIERFTSSLNAVLTENPVNNFHYQYWQATCHLWNLGLKGTVVRLEPDNGLSVGQRIPVKISQLELGITSRLDLLRR